MPAASTSRSTHFAAGSEHSCRSIASSPVRPSSKPGRARGAHPARARQLRALGHSRLPHARDRRPAAVHLDRLRPPITRLWLPVCAGKRVGLVPEPRPPPRAAGHRVTIELPIDDTRRYVIDRALSSPHPGSLASTASPARPSPAAIAPLGSPPIASGQALLQPAGRAPLPHGLSRPPAPGQHPRRPRPHRPAGEDPRLRIELAPAARARGSRPLHPARQRAPHPSPSRPSCRLREPGRHRIPPGSATRRRTLGQRQTNL